MKSLSTTGLVLLLSLGFLPSQSHAQMEAYSTPSLLPLPSAPSTEQWVRASYYEPPTASESFGSSFTSRKAPEAQAPAPAPGAFGNAVQSDWDCAGCGQNSDSGYAWFVYAGGIIMGRNRANPFWTTFETNNNVNQLFNTQNAGANWSGGGEIMVGRICCCTGFGWAFSYWQLAPMTTTVGIVDPNNNLSTPIDLNDQNGPVRIGNGAGPTAASFFDNSHEHRISRDDRVVNLEINAIQMAWINNDWLQLYGLAGFRYFRFDEKLTFGAAQANQNFGDNGGINEAYLQSQCVNNLYGGQFGGFANILLTERLGLWISPKAGIFGNQMNVQNRLFRGDGLEGWGLSTGNVASPIFAHKSDVSFLGEITTGLNYGFTNNFRGWLGYRVVGVTGLALADNQFLPFLADTAGFAQVKQNGDLILHGIMIGASYNF